MCYYSIYIKTKSGPTFTHHAPGVVYLLLRPRTPHNCDEYPRETRDKVEVEESRGEKDGAVRDNRI